MKVLYFSQLVYSATPMTLVAIGMLWLLASTVLLALAFRTAIVAAWQEPILRAPVLILESDDWGYGPLEQANALTRICALYSLQALSSREARFTPSPMTV